jgi:hypothetical protein
VSASCKGVGHSIDCKDQGTDIEVGHASYNRHSDISLLCSQHLKHSCLATSHMAVVIECHRQLLWTFVLAAQITLPMNLALHHKPMMPTASLGVRLRIQNTSLSCYKSLDSKRSHLVRCRVSSRKTSQRVNRTFIVEVFGVYYWAKVAAIKQAIAFVVVQVQSGSGQSPSKATSGATIEVNIGSTQ